MERQFTDKELILINELKDLFIRDATFHSAQVVLRPGGLEGGKYVLSIAIENWHKIFKTYESIERGIIKTKNGK